MNSDKGRNSTAAPVQSVPPVDWTSLPRNTVWGNICLLYTSDAADE